MPRTSVSVGDEEKERQRGRPETGRGGRAVLGHIGSGALGDSAGRDRCGQHLRAATRAKAPRPVFLPLVQPEHVISFFPIGYCNFWPHGNM